MLVPLSNLAAFQFNQRLARSASQNDALCRALLPEKIFSWLAEHAGSQPEDQATLRDNLRLIRSASGKNRRDHHDFGRHLHVHAHTLDGRWRQVKNGFRFSLKASMNRISTPYSGSIQTIRDH